MRPDPSRVAAAWDSRVAAEPLGTVDFGVAGTLITVRWFNGTAISTVDDEGATKRYEKVTRVLRESLEEEATKLAAKGTLVSIHGVPASRDLGLAFGQPKVEKENNRGQWLNVLTFRVDTTPPHMLDIRSDAGFALRSAATKALKRAGFKESRAR